MDAKATWETNTILQMGDLVRRFAEGDMAAFAILVTRYQNGVFLFFCRMTGRRADAEDLAQETFVRVYESLHSLE